MIQKKPHAWVSGTLLLLWESEFSLAPSQAPTAIGWEFNARLTATLEDWS